MVRFFKRAGLAEIDEELEAPSKSLSLRYSMPRLLAWSYPDMPEIAFQCSFKGFTPALCLMQSYSLLLSLGSQVCRAVATRWGCSGLLYKARLRGSACYHQPQ